jgi:O-antigen biosynthesis protein WbqP
MYRTFAKRALDATFSLLLVVVLSPLLLALALRVRGDSPGPVLFRQRRVGRDGAEFLIYKFRTMRTDADPDVPTAELRDPDAWITKSGAFLRRTSLDELPQLLNILRGEMSFVGPRPALWNQDDLIALRKASGADRLRPGLTGLAQTRGRDELPVPQKAAYDAQYAERVTFVDDLRILLATASGVLKQEGVREGSA